MIIELERAHTPGDYGNEETCGVCGERFTVEVVFATLVSETRDDLGVACPACVALMGRYRPEKFPTIEEYEEALARFGEAGPIWGSSEEASLSWEEGEPRLAAIEASRTARSRAVGEGAVLAAIGRSDGFNTAAVLIEDLPDEAFGAHDRERVVRLLSSAGDEAAAECEKLKEAFGIPTAFA